ncbi:MAG: Ni/Fe hydrogenase subunit alpha [Dehalococcoidia bacterium]|jgi:F420-non-reducing hydrogenase large subunit|nr:Ni/Fe hydrogenase subunit alpha [Chloroflexota bacterium]MCK4241935.1 Ni/Fe hydrogenase subunit alpha [Dehalococcoidia bacterium]
MKRISIDPITRLEGHGKIEIFLDDAGEVANAYFQVPELRGFEKFCEGRLVEDMPQITERICGVCPEAHHMASVKAVDAVYHIDPPSTGKKLRELMYSAFYVADHTTHFYILSGPDFIMGPDANPAERNILGVIAKVPDVGMEVIKAREMGHEIIEMVAGRKVHPCGALPGGMSHGLNEEERQRIEEMARSLLEFAKFTIKVFDDIVLANKAYVDLILSDSYTHRTYYMGLVDENNKVNFYDGKVRVVDTEGKEFVKYAPREYLEHVAEYVEPWTYLKFPYLKKVGWRGLVDGQDSGVYRATPLSRLNAADGMTTPLAQAEYERMYSTLGGKPVHATLATHWARIIELLYAAERLLELSVDSEITGPEYRIIPTTTPDEGVGIVEAPRGTLTHHYITDEHGVVNKVNLIVGTTNNNAAISMSIKKAAQGLIKGGKEITEGLLNKIEMAFRAYDPCLACATHSLPGQMPLEVKIYDSQRNLVQVVRRD